MNEPHLRADCSLNVSIHSTHHTPTALSVPLLKFIGASECLISQVSGAQNHINIGWMFF